MGITAEELAGAAGFAETLLFTYQEGMNWTRELYKHGGWSQVSEAYTTLPQSTEQVLHAEKYLAHEAPVKVALPDVTNPLNGGRQRSASSYGLTAPVSWKKLASDVNGEWGFYLILDQFLKSPGESHRAAAGWAGDRTAVYESSKGEVLYISLSTWDTENDAREFFDAYVKRTQLRYPEAAASDSATPPSFPSFSKRFSTGEGIMRMIFAAISTHIRRC